MSEDRTAILSREDKTPILHRIAELLQGEGFRAKIGDDGTFVVSAAAGQTFFVNPHANNVQFRSIITLGTPAAFTVDDANAFNQTYRFSKIYLDNDGDAILESDHYFGIEDPNFDEKIRAILPLWESLLGLFRNAVNKATDKATDS